MLGNCRASATIAIHHAISLGVGFGAVIDVDVQDVLTEEGFVADFGDDELAFLVDRQEVAEVRAFADGFVFLHTDPSEAFLAVDVECFIGDDHFVCHDFFERGQLGLTFAAFAVFLDQLFEPPDGVFGKLLEVALRFLDGLFEAFDQFVGTNRVELGNALNLNFEQTQNVVAGDFAFKDFFVGLESDIDGLDYSFPSLFFFDTAVNTFLDKDFFE